MKENGLFNVKYNFRKLYCFSYIMQVSAAEDVLVFYNERASFNTFVNMMKEDRNRMDYDDSSPLR